MRLDSRSHLPEWYLRITAAFTAMCIPGLVLAVSTATCVAAQDFRVGRSAYNGSDYVAAFAQWLPLAETGHAKAQASLAYLYLKGLGVPQDNAKAAKWYARAAAQGQVDALHFLGILYLKGAGVRQDYSRAHVLCELAITRGAPQALRCRDEAISNLDQATISENFRRIAEWFEKFDGLEKKEAVPNPKRLSQQQNFLKHK